MPDKDGGSVAGTDSGATAPRPEAPLQSPTLAARQLPGGAV